MKLPRWTGLPVIQVLSCTRDGKITMKVDHEGEAMNTYKCKFEVRTIDKCSSICTLDVDGEDEEDACAEAAKVLGEAETWIFSDDGREFVKWELITRIRITEISKIGD